jgi:predicted dehydrogenase
MYNAAIIGISGFGKIHYNDLKQQAESGACRIVAATVINQDEEQEKCQWLTAHGAKLFTDWEEMLEEFSGQIDVCFIPTGIAMHAPMSIKSMQTGANVFVEKPVTATIQEVREMEKVSAETGKFVAVGFQNIYQPDAQQLKQVLLSGKMGKLKCLKARGFWSRDSLYYGRNNWAGKLRNNGSWVLDSPFNNALAHFLNMICFLAGSEFRKSAALREINAELYRANKIESADTACIRAVTQDNVNILFYVTHAVTEQSPVYIEIECERGKVIFELDKSHIELRMDDGAVETIPTTPHSDYRRHVMDALKARLNDPAAFVCTLDIAAVHTLCVNGAHESSGVNEVPEEFIETVAEGDAVVTYIKNLTNIIIRAFDKNKLLSETGVKWAVPGDTVSLLDYNEFKGGKC